MLSRAGESELIEACYQAAGDPSRWNAALSRLVELVGADEALLVGDDPGGPAPPAFHATRPRSDPLWEVYLGRHRVNPWTASSLVLPAGSVRRAEEAVPRQTLLDSGFYQECLRPIGVLHALGVNLINEPGLFAYLGFLRSPRAGRFDDSRLELMGRLGRHVGQAVRLQLRLQGCELERAAAFETLGRVARGVVLIDGGRRICFANPVAERTLREADGLHGERARLRASTRDEDARLQRLLVEASSEAGDGQVRRGGTMALRRPSGLPPLTVEVLPLGDHGKRCGRAAPRAAVFLSHQDQSRPVSGRLLGDAFGLTPAESRVCALLAEGLSLKRIGEWLAVSHNTVRTHLSHAFDKTGARRQADLIKLLLATSPGARAP